jgi:hypothetical protein
VLYELASVVKDGAEEKPPRNLKGLGLPEWKNKDLGGAITHPAFFEMPCSSDGKDCEVETNDCLQIPGPKKN